MKKLSIGCVCGQSGSAAALFPVLEMGIQQYGWIESVKVYGEAIAVFEKTILHTETCGEFYSEAEAVEWLRQLCPDVVLVGSDATRHVEKSVARAAALLNIPSVMFIDFWSNYAARFVDDQGIVVPDAVAVIDERMAKSLREVEEVADRIFVTGSPALEQTKKRLENCKDDRRRVLRKQEGIDVGDICILFISSPGSTDDYDYNLSVSSKPHSLLPILEEIVENLTDSLITRHGKIHLFVRPHPRESVASFKRLSSDSIRIVVSDNLSSFESLLIADVVIGLDTVLLIEALIAQRKVICIDYVRPLNESVRLLAQSANVLIDTPELLVAALNDCIPIEMLEHSKSKIDFVTGATECLTSLIIDISENSK